MLGTADAAFHGTAAPEAQQRLKQCNVCRRARACPRFLTSTDGTHPPCFRINPCPRFLQAYWTLNEVSREMEDPYCFGACISNPCQLARQLGSALRIHRA